MRRRFGFGLFLGLTLPALATPSLASAAVIDFDDLTDSEFISTQYPDVTFSNAIALTAGTSLSEFEFPPRSGSNVASDAGGFLRIDFSQPVRNVGGFFTYVVPLMLNAFKANDLLLASSTSLFTSNMALSGDPGRSPNEFLALFQGNISAECVTHVPGLFCYPYSPDHPLRLTLSSFTPHSSPHHPSGGAS